MCWVTQKAADLQQVRRLLQGRTTWKNHGVWFKMVTMILVKVLLSGLLCLLWFLWFITHLISQKSPCSWMLMDTHAWAPTYESSWDAEHWQTAGEVQNATTGEEPRDVEFVDPQLLSYQLPSAAGSFLAKWSRSERKQRSREESESDGSLISRQSRWSWFLLIFNCKLPPRMVMFSLLHTVCKPSLPSSAWHIF